MKTTGIVLVGLMVLGLSGKTRLACILGRLQRRGGISRPSIALPSASPRHRRRGYVRAGRPCARAVAVPPGSNGHKLTFSRVSSCRPGRGAERMAADAAGHGTAGFLHRGGAGRLCLGRAEYVRCCPMPSFLTWKPIVRTESWRGLRVSNPAWKIESQNWMLRCRSSARPPAFR